MLDWKDILRSKIKGKMPNLQEFCNMNIFKIDLKITATFILSTCKYGNKLELRTKQLLPSRSLTFASLIVPRFLTENQNIPICTLKSGDINISTTMYMSVYICIS